MSSFLLPSLASDFSSSKKPRPVLARADSLPSPPPSRVRPTARPLGLDDAPALLASPPSSSDVEVESPTHLLEQARPALQGPVRRVVDVGESPIQARVGRQSKAAEQQRRTPPMAGAGTGRNAVPTHLQDGPSNPFTAHAGEGDARRAPPRKAKKPDKLTYVFRGKRITYDVPYDALVAPEDPTESPFPDPSPRLLFPAPPITPPPVASTSLTFLDRLRGDPQKEIQHGLPTPARESSSKKRARERGDDAASARTNAFERMKVEERVRKFEEDGEGSKMRASR